MPSLWPGGQLTHTFMLLHSNRQYHDCTGVLFTLFKAFCLLIYGFAYLLPNSRDKKTNNIFLCVSSSHTVKQANTPSIRRHCDFLRQRWQQPAIIPVPFSCQPFDYQLLQGMVYCMEAEKIFLWYIWFTEYIPQGALQDQEEYSFRMSVNFMVSPTDTLL